MLCYCNVK